MPDGSPSPRARRVRRTETRGSVELLLELAGDPAVAETLRGGGLDPARLAELSRARARQTEPADWRHRLSQRASGRGTSSLVALEQLLAIVRSAELDAYHLLDEAGVSPSRLRKLLIAAIRDAQLATKEARPPARGRRAPQSAPSVSTFPVRQSRAGSVRAPRPTAPASSPAIQQVRTPSPAPRARAESRPGVEPEPSRGTLVPIATHALPPLIGRDALLDRMAVALLRKQSRPTLLVGAHGAGKTATASHLADRVSEPVYLIQLPDFEDDADLGAALDEVGDGVAIIDGLDAIATDQPPPTLPALTRAWHRGSPRTVTLATAQTRARLTSWVPGVDAVLDPVPLPTLDDEVLRRAVQAGAAHLAEAHGLDHDTRSFTDLVRLVQRFGSGLALPGRALDLIDVVGAALARAGASHIQPEDWMDALAAQANLPVERLHRDRDDALLHLEDSLADRVVGHRETISTIAGLVRRNRAGFASARPVATVLLLGPSGVGKTELAKGLANTLFETEQLVRLDMSEYAEAHAVARVVGAPPGYVGHEQGGALTDPVRRQPHCVVLLDEIEKAHRDVHQLLLQVFDEGRLTDGRGQTVDFRHALVVMTSNLGAEHATASGSPEDVLSAARAAFPVELWNRIEAPLVMGSLSAAELREVCQRLAQRSSALLEREQGIRYGLTAAAIEQLLALAGHDEALGARPLRHLIARHVESLVADAVLRGRLRRGTQTLVDVHQGTFTLST